MVKGEVAWQWRTQFTCLGYYLHSLIRGRLGPQLYAVSLWPDAHGYATDFVTLCELLANAGQDLGDPPTESDEAIERDPLLGQAWAQADLQLTEFSHQASIWFLDVGPLLTDAVQLPPFVFFGSSHFGSIDSLNR